MSRRGVPTYLEPHISNLSSGDLHVLTSLLGASTNWLILQYVLRHVSTKAKQITGVEESESKDGKTRVVLVSFLRDYKFWRDGARRLGVDLDKATSENTFHFVDGLTQLFHGSPSHQAPARLASTTLSDATLSKIEGPVLTACGAGTAQSTILIVDGLDFVLASTKTTSLELVDTIMEWREHAKAVIVTAAGDFPLIHSQKSPLEVEHSSLVISLAGRAKVMMSLRLLDSGTAKDVSGVLRLTSRGNDTDDNEKDLLYAIAGDGTAKVFERGSN